MGQSLVQNYLHIVFSTKHRKKLIHPPYDKELYAYLAGTCNELACPALKVSGYQNHVHILCRLSPRIALADLMMKLKANSSKWYKTKHESLHDFFWQNGYGAFSVSRSHVERVSAYIENQEEHHRQKTFQEEYRTFLEKYNVEYDERYVWD